MAFTPLPSPEETVRLYLAGELGAALALRYEESTEDETPFISQCVSLHNERKIDLLATVSSQSFAALKGPRFFLAQTFYLKAIPKLHAQVRELMTCCSVLVKQGGTDGAATWPNGAFQEWCATNPEAARAVIVQARDGDELAMEFATFALRSVNDVDAAIQFISNFSDSRRLSGITALGGMQYPDVGVMRKTLTKLEELLSPGTDDHVRSNALLSAFNILTTEPDPAIASTFIAAAIKDAGPATLFGLSNVVWLHSKQLDSPSLASALQALRAVPADNLGTVHNLDMALHRLLGTPHEALVMDYLTDVLANPPLTPTNFEITTHTLARERTQRLYELLMRWLLSGKLSLYVHTRELLGHEDQPFNTNASALNLTPAQQIFVCRKAIGFLFVKPVTCCSVIVSVLRSATKESTATLSDLLFDPMLLNYGGDAKNYLKTIPKTDGAYRAVRAALAKDKAFYDGLDRTGTIKELHPSEYQRDVERQRHHDEMREVQKLAESKSVLMNLVHRSTMLYGKRSLTYVTDQTGKQRSISMDLKSIEASFELPRREILDPVGLNYMLWMYRAEKLK